MGVDASETTMASWWLPTNIRDYWWTAVGRGGEAVPVPFDVRKPLDKRGLLRRGLFVGGVIAVFCILSATMSSGWAQDDLARKTAGILLISLVGGLVVCVLELLSGAVAWPFLRRMMGEGLEATADAWSPSELDEHIRHIRAEHARTEGYAKRLHARHLAWLEARRDGTPRS